MKNRLFFSWAVLATLILFSKNSNAQCGPEAQEFLWVNEIGANILNGGDLFWNRSDGKFIAPYIPGEIETSTIFAQGLWLGGFDSDGQLKIACQQYGNANGNSDYWPGPIDDNSGEVFPNGCNDFDYIWSVKRGEVLQIINDFANNSTIDLPIPEDILKWPGRGNPHFEEMMGFPLPDQDFAPFHDEDGDGIYDPMNGDRPILDPAMPNAIPDEMTWCVFNDIQDIHQETNSEPIGVEVQQMAYAFNSADDEVLNRTIFTKYIIQKKTEGALDGFRMGAWIDLGLGCYSDDYIGCDTSLNTQYVYNQDNDDNSPFCTTIGTYGENPPVQTATFLNHKMSSFMLMNPSFLPPPFGEGYYYYLSSRWADGTPLTYGGEGYDPSSTDYVSHAFPSNPNDPDGWSMTSEMLPERDRRTVMAIGPYPLPNGESITVDMAYTYHRGNGLDHLENVDFALQNVAALQSVYDSEFNGGEVGQFNFCDDTDCKWPGDATGDGIAKEDDLLFLGVAMGMGATGPPASPPSVIWAGQETEDWGQTFFNGRDFKHADFNGDGMPDEIDEEVLRLNFGSTVPDFIPIDDTPAPFAEGEVFVEWNKDEVSTTDNPLQRLIRADITLGSETEPFSEPLCGIAFTVAYDTSVLEPSFLNLIELANNVFLGDDDEIIHVLNENPLEGRLAIGVARKDGQSIDPAYGNIAKLGFRFREDAQTTNPTGTDSISVEIFNLVGVNETIGFFTLGAVTDTFVGTDMAVVSSTEEKLVENSFIHILPNPNKGSFNLLSSDITQSLSLAVFDLQGRMVWHGQMPSGQERISIDLENHLRSGMYMLKAVREDGLFITRKLLVK